MVNLCNFDIPYGNDSSAFCDKCKSVKFSNPPISSGNSSNLKLKFFFFVSHKENHHSNVKYEN